MLAAAGTNVVPSRMFSRRLSLSIRSSILSLALLVPTISIAASQKEIVSRVIRNVEARFERSKLFKKYSSAQKNKSSLEEGAFIANPSRAKVMTLINADDFISLLQDTMFKNQHQTGYSGGGGYNPSMRYDLEENLSGVKLARLMKDSELLKQVLPKYGMVEFHDFADDPGAQEFWATELIGSEELDLYGEIAIYFKDSVKKRTTFLPADSGNLGLRKDIGEWVQSLRKKQIILDPDQIGRGRFFEAQIWGKVTTDDIDYVVIPVELFYDNSGNIKQVEETLKESGIPFYRERRARTATEKIMERLRVRFKANKRLGPPSEKCAQLISPDNVGS